MTRRAPAAAAVALAFCLAAGAAGAAGGWTPVSTGAVQGADVTGIARGTDGVLHVAWVRRGAAASALWQTRIGVDGRTLGSEPIAGGLADPGSPALVAGADGSVRSFVFVQGPDATTANLATAAQTATGFALAPDPLAQATGAGIPAVAAATARDGTPIVAWAVGTQVRYRIGLDAAAPAVALGAGGCCASATQAAVDQSTGQAFVAWASSAPGSSGVFVQAVDRGGPRRAKVFATGSAAAGRSDAVLPEGRVALASRPGLPGVYLAYTVGFPVARAVQVLRAGARTVVLRVKAPGAGHVVLAGAPQGRLWLVWTRGKAIFAARTNRSATRLGAVRKLALRKGATAVDQLQGDGSTGALDLVATLAGRGGERIWHEQLLPGLSLAIAAQGAADAPRRYTFRVTDAGEAVANATVRFGKQTLTTGIAGTVTLTTTDRPVSATATKTGYAPAVTPLP
jgi:hypothetical protein